MKLITPCLTLLSLSLLSTLAVATPATSKTPMAASKPVPIGHYITQNTLSRTLDSTNVHTPWLSYFAIDPFTWGHTSTYSKTTGGAGSGSGSGASVGDSGLRVINASKNLYILVTDKDLSTYAGTITPCGIITSLSPTAARAYDTACPNASPKAAGGGGNRLFLFNTNSGMKKDTYISHLLPQCQLSFPPYSNNSYKLITNTTLISRATTFSPSNCSIIT